MLLWIKYFYILYASDKIEECMNLNQVTGPIFYEIDWLTWLRFEF